MPSVEVSRRVPSQPAQPAATTGAAPNDQEWAGLRSALEGALILPSDSDYDSVRRVWNGSVDRRPAAIARCRGPADVAASTRFARDRGLLVAVRGGGHSLPGHSVCDGGLVIDLSALRRVDVDPHRRTARAEPGATWGDFDAATQEHGLATTGGQVATTGIAGLTLGGGLGYLMREHGLTCDNLLAAELVTADGEQVRASADENPDLLWGLQGGGGNFGVVTALEYGLHPATPLFGGFIVHDAARAGPVLRFWRDHIADAPDHTFNEAVLFVAPAEPPYPEEIHGRSVLSLASFAFGDPERAEELLRPLAEFGPPVTALLWPMAYTNVQSIFSAPSGRLRYEKSDFLATLPDDAIDTLVAAAATTTNPMSQLVLVQLGGAMSRVDPLATAFSHRDAGFFFTASTSWADGGGEHVAWARTAWSALRPWARGVYVNFLDGDDDEDRLRQAYGPRTHDRLVALKDRWDPTNLFRLNQNIKPTMGAGHE